jgi:predicted Zn-dependent protease
MLTDYREIVAILAHEIGHIAMRHGYRDLAIDTARENMKESFDELDSETLTEEEMELSDELQSIIDSAVEALKLVRDDIEEYEADDVALELLRRYKINRSYLKNTLAKVYLKLGSSYPEYKTQFERRISRIK